MSKIEWGLKRYCQKCHTKYYDMQKDPITCPKCGTLYQQEILKSRGDLRGEYEEDDLLKDDVLEADDLDDFDGEDIEDAVDIKDHGDEKHV